MDWNKPTNSDPAHPNVLSDLNDKDTYAITLGQTNAGFTALPEGTINYDHDGKFLRRKEGTLFNPVQISLAGGGTGASDAQGARQNLNVGESGTELNQVRTNQQNNNVFCQLTRQVATQSPLSGGGQLDGDLTLTIQDATTAQKGAVQLDNTLTGTAVDKALTAAQGKALNDKITPLQNIVDVGFYQEQVLGTSGNLSVGSCKIVRVGSLVTISGSFSHSSSSSPSSSTGYIPIWGRPSYTPSVNAYLVIEGAFSAIVNAHSDGVIGFQYSQNQTITNEFTISYTV